MRRIVLRIANRIAIFRAQLWIAKCNCRIDSRMSINVLSIMRQSTQCERILVGILALVEQFDNEISATDVM